MEKKLIAALIVASTLVAPLTGCAPSSSIGHIFEPDGQKSVDPSPSVSVKNLYGKADPDDVAILCVEGSAFLYVWKGDIQKGGPSLARFVEQDTTCAPEPAE
jgi:hypothetical protein